MHKKVNVQAALQASTRATKASKDTQDIKMTDNATTGKDSTVDVHLPLNSHGKAKYPNQIYPKISSKYMSCHHSLGATGATLNTRNASS